jgi:trehalose synthase
VRAGGHVVWRCHVGLDVPNDQVHEAWDFLEPYVREAHAYVFSRATYAWTGLDPDRVTIIRPSIDVFSAKNQKLAPENVRAILQAAGLLADGDRHLATFVRHDGSPGRVDRRARMVEEAPIPADAPVICQVSRWDELKDPVGVIEGFCAHLPDHEEAHLLLAGPDVAAVADDPEGRAVFERCVAFRDGLPAEQRARVHFASLPMDDPEENAAIVNAIQRYATIVVQKSLAEGFGLTVAEAMWKSRPVVASRIGGIQEQVVDGENGLLIADPRDLAAFGAALARLLDDPALARSLGDAAHERVREEFLAPRHLAQYVQLIERVASSV